MQNSVDWKDTQERMRNQGFPGRAGLGLVLPALTLTHSTKEYLVPSARHGLLNHFLNSTGSRGVLADALLVLMLPVAALTCSAGKQGTGKAHASEMGNGRRR